MDIEMQLREMLVLRDPGTRFTDNVLARVGEVPAGQARDGVVRLADARAGKRGRRMLLGTLVVMAAAAATLPFMLDHGGGLPAEQEGAAVTSPARLAPVADPPMPEVAAGAAVAGDVALDCVDPDVLNGLLLQGSGNQAFSIVSSAPAELAQFKPPRPLAWLGSTERSSGSTRQSMAVYRTSLAADAARTLAAEALLAGGWALHADHRYIGSSVFVTSHSMPFSQTYCREGSPVTLMANTLDGETYVVLTVNRSSGTAGLMNACDQPVQPVRRPTSQLDEHMPTLELPRDPRTGQPAAMSSIGGGSGDETKRRASASFQVKDSVDGVARHFASQVAAQGWQPDASWSAAGTAGSTWTRQLDGASTLQGMLLVTTFDDDWFTAVFRIARTN